MRLRSKKVWAYLHSASGSLVSSSVLWLKPLLWFDSLFYFVTFVFFSISHAALHGTWPLTPNCPSILTRLFHHSPTPLPSHPLPSPTPPTPEQTAVSDRRGAWEVQPSRQANSSYLTSHLAADRHGGSVQVYTPHLINQQPPHKISMESDLSHGMNRS